MSVIVDKLTRRKFLSRKQDPDDRRRWLLQVNPAVVKKVDALYAAHASRGRSDVGRVSRHSDEIFDVLLEFVGSLADELKRSAIELGHGRGVRSPANGTTDSFEQEALIKTVRPRLADSAG